MTKIDIYRSFEQWKNGNVLEHGVPRTEYYSEAQLDLVEMGWNYGYDAGRAVEQALDKKAENARELGLTYEPALTEVLNNPEEHYPGNFDTPKRANALLTGLCQDAAIEIAQMQGELLEQCRINGMSAEREEALRAEVERLNKALHWEQNRAERIGTHGPGCHLWGDRHYECLLRELQARTMDFKAGKEVRTHTPEDVQKIKSAWVGLTAKERSELWWKTDMSKMPEHDYGKAIEAKLKEKNT